jgi:hypothetical protein
MIYRDKPATKREFLALLRASDACDPAIAFVSSCTTTQRAWETCNRGDWMLWLLIRLSRRRDIEDNVVRELACDFAESVLHVYEERFPDDDRVRRAIALTRSGRLAEALEHAAAAYAAAADAACSAAFASAHAADADAERRKQANIIRARVPWATVERALRRTA